MISSKAEFEKTDIEINSLGQRLQKLQQNYPIGSKGFTKAGIRKLIARLQEEMAVFEGSQEARQPRSD